MDVGKFKATRARLTAWFVIPPLLMMVCGFGSFLLERKAHWEISRVEALSRILPGMDRTRQDALQMLNQFRAEGGSIQSEEQLITYLREVAQRTGFPVDTVKVDRETAEKKRKTDSLVASIRGEAPLHVIQQFLHDVGGAQDLLSDRSIKLTQARVGDASVYRADFTFELLLFKQAGGAK